jgi:spermidine synthase
MQQVRDHLSEGGVFVQWMNASFLDESLLRSLTATLVSAFGEVRLYRPDPDTLVFLASSKPLEPEAVLLASSANHYSHQGINNAEDLLAALAADADGARALAAGTAPITDDHNRMATAALYDSGKGLDRRSLSGLLAPYDPVQHADSWVFRTYRDRLSFSYVEQRMAIYTSMDPSITQRIDAMNSALAGGAVMNAVLREGRPSTDATATIAHARELAQANEWKAVSELDGALAQIAWTDSAKGEAIQLRAEWRSHVISPASRRQFGDECISIIDEATVSRPTLALYGLRARCGVLAARNDVVIESLWSLGNGTYHNALHEPAERREIARKDLQTLVIALEKNVPVADAGDFDSTRRDEAALKLRAHISRLQP